MNNINQSYTCPRCHGVFPLNDKDLHNSVCTGSTNNNNNNNNNSNSNNNNNSNENNNDIQTIVDDNGNITEIKKEVAPNGSIKTTTTKKDPNGNIISQTMNVSGNNGFGNNMIFSFSSFNNNFPNNMNMNMNNMNSMNNMNNMNIFGSGLNNIMSSIANNINNAVRNNLNLNFNDENANNALDPQILNNLLVIKIDESELSENETECIICMENFKKDDDGVYLPCQHLFHKDCLFEWFKIKDCCPTCKTKVTRENTDIYG
jgi:hypothetical protein